MKNYFPAINLTLQLLLASYSWQKIFKRTARGDKLAFATSSRDDGIKSHQKRDERDNGVENAIEPHYTN